MKLSRLLFTTTNKSSPRSSASTSTVSSVSLEKSVQKAFVNAIQYPDKFVSSKQLSQLNNLLKKIVKDKKTGNLQYVKNKLKTNNFDVSYLFIIKNVEDIDTGYFNSNRGELFHIWVGVYHFIFIATLFGKDLSILSQKVKNAYHDYKNSGVKRAIDYANKYY